MTKRAVSWLLGLALLNTAQAGGSPPSGSCCHIDITGLQYAGGAEIPDGAGNG